MTGDEHGRLGHCLNQNKQYDDAMIHCLTAVKKAPKKATWQFNLGNALREKGDTDGCIAAYKQAIKLDGEYADAYFNLGHVQKTNSEV